MRVIAGEFGGRALVAPRGSRTRPTSDRVREALFMSLGDLRESVVVDLFAGSGALGVEALSRGAAHVHFVDADRMARMAIEENLTALGIRDRATVWPLRLPHGLRRLAEPLASAELVLLDPPYGGAEARAVLAMLGGDAVLPAHARVVLERHQKDEVPERSGGLERVRERRYGETVIDVYQLRARMPQQGEAT